MSRTTPKDLDPKHELVAADGYAAMFQDAPPPTEDDLRDLQPSETDDEQRVAPAPQRRERLRIASVA